MKRVRTAVAGILLWVGSVSAGSGQEVSPSGRVMTLYGGEKHGPIVCSSSEIGPGLLTERAMELFHRAGYGTRMECTAWSRAQAVVKSDPDGVILNLARTEDREEEYLWLLKTGEVSYGLATSDPTLRTLEEALGKGIVVAVRGTPRVTELQAIGPEKHIVQVNEPEQAARMLVAGRVVAWYDTATRIERIWPADLGISVRPYFVPTRRISGYLAAGHAVKDADGLRSKLEQAYGQMQSDGSWTAIAQRYSGLAN